MILTVFLALSVLFLLLYLLIFRHSIREAAGELDEKLKTDTNTLISISTGDRAIRALAVQINNQPQALLTERLRLQVGRDKLRRPLRTSLTTCAQRSPPSAAISICWNKNRSPRRRSAILLWCGSGRTPCGA